MEKTAPILGLIEMEFIQEGEKVYTINVIDIILSI